MGFDNGLTVVQKCGHFIFFQLEGRRTISDFITFRNGACPNKKQTPCLGFGENQNISSETVGKFSYKSRVAI